MFEIFTETLEQIVTKSHKILYLNRKEDIYSKIWNFSNFWENRLNRKAIAFDKISQNCAFYGNSINIHLLGYFCMQNSYLRWKQCKILRFSWKRKNNRKSFIFVNCLRFSLKVLSRLSQNFTNNIFRWKRRQIKQN